MQQTTLGARLASAVPYLRPGTRIVDVGTDHAYLPIHLVQSGIAARALACDINQGPILSAREHIAAAGLSDVIETLQTDGLHGVEGFRPDHILIFGMGGELIVRILDEAPWIRDPSIGLVLQPMSRASVLRRYLCETGFAIEGETLSYEEKYYQTISARWSGTPTPCTELECWVGKGNILSRPPLFEGFVKHEIAVFDAILRGKSRAESPDLAADLKMKQSLEELL